MIFFMFIQFSFKKFSLSEKLRNLKNNEDSQIFSKTAFKLYLEK